MLRATDWMAARQPHHCYPTSHRKPVLRIIEIEATDPTTVPNRQCKTMEALLAFGATEYQTASRETCDSLMNIFRDFDNDDPDAGDTFHRLARELNHFVV